MYVTTEQIIKAMEDNGYTHTRGSWFATHYDSRGKPVIVGACIMGQAALNLGIEEVDVLTILNNAIAFDETRLTARGLGNIIMSMNDQIKAPYSKMLNKVKSNMEPFAGRRWLVKKKKFRAIKQENL